MIVCHLFHMNVFNILHNYQLTLTPRIDSSSHMITSFPTSCFRYSHSLAKFLCSVYEGLMMRPPRELLTPSKWSGDDESPLRRSVNSVSSVAQNGRQSRCVLASMTFVIQSFLIEIWNVFRVFFGFALLCSGICLQNLLSGCNKILTCIKQSLC